jgi:hypothetical protein
LRQGKQRETDGYERHDSLSDRGAHAGNVRQSRMWNNWTATPHKGKILLAVIWEGINERKMYG